MAEFLVVVVNLLSFFAAVVCVLAWYQASIPIHRLAPSVVTRVPLVIGAFVLVTMLARGSVTRPGPWDELLVFAAATAAASFCMCFLYGWLRKGTLDRNQAGTREGSFGPIMIARSVGLIVMLVVTGVNMAVWQRALPFWIEITGHAA
jgi:hypothetical protein